MNPLGVLSVLLATSVLGMAVAAAVAVTTIPALFGSTVPDHAAPVIAGAGFVFAVFTVSAFVWRRLLSRARTGNPDA